MDLFFEEAGPARAPVLLLGGTLGTDGATWHPQLRELCKQVRVVAFDHRGHGRSPAPPAPYRIADLGADVLRLIDRLGVERVSYAGTSLGGMVGQWLAAHHPERVDKLILIATSAHLGSGGLWNERASVVRRAGTTEVIADAVINRWLTPGWAAAHPHVVASLRDVLCANDSDGYAACCEAIAAADLRADLKRIQAPTLVIGGGSDTAIPLEHQRAIAAAVHGARLEIIEGAAHAPSIEHADIVNRLIGEHLGVGVS